jgi:hypothetical protein
MPDPIAPQPIPDLRKVPVEIYRDEFSSLVKRLEQEEIEHPVAVPPRPFRDPAMGQAEYERK